MVDLNAEVLAKQLLAWSDSDRARLAELLIASLEPVEADIDAAWESEIDRRAAELDAGIGGIPAEQVFAEIDRRLQL